jgi:KUP system potassium uptake protein
MAITTFLTYFVLRYTFRYPLWLCAGATGFFLAIDAVFFAAAAHKILDGGWFPLALAAAVLALMMTWRRGRDRMRERLRGGSPPLPAFLQTLLAHPPQRVPGTAVFLTATAEVTPNALLHSLKHYKVLHERNVFLTVESRDVPWIAPEERIRSERIAENCWRLTARYGFMEQPDVVHALELWPGDGTPVEPMEVSYFLSREKVVPGTTQRGRARWRDRLFAAMSRNAASVTDFFNIPGNRVVELGTRVEL